MIHTSYQTRPIVVAYHRGEPVVLESAARLRHLYIVGQTGTGKSSLVANMIAQDVAAGHGLALIDPHGSLATDVLSLIPTAQDCSHRVVYFKPTDIEHPIGLNAELKVRHCVTLDGAGSVPLHGCHEQRPPRRSSPPCCMSIFQRFPKYVL